MWCYLLLLVAQDVPKDVKYERATDAVNKLAMQKLQAFYSKTVVKADFKPMAHSTLIVGPGLWAAMKGVRGEFEKPKNVEFMVPNKSGVQKLNGMMPTTSNDQELTWISVHMALSKVGKVKIRKAKANELSYYWALIPYNLTEPIYVADNGKHALIFDFDDNKKDPRPMFVDKIGYVEK